MTQDYMGAEWERILGLIKFLLSDPDKFATILPELPESDEVKVGVAMACRFASPESHKFIETMIDNSDPTLVLSALQIVPREELSRLVLQAFEGGRLGQAMKFIVDSLSETELIAFAFSCLLSRHTFLFSILLGNILTETRRKEVLESIRRKQGLA